MLKLQTRFMLTALAIFVISIAFVEVVSFSEFRSNLEDNVVSSLEERADVIESFLDEYIEEQVEKLQLIATHVIVSNSELVSIVSLKEEFFEIFVLDSNGIVIFSSDISHVGDDKSTDLYFLNAKSESYIKPAYYSETVTDNIFTVSRPYKDGVLVARISLDVFDDFLFNKVNSYETGEVLLAYKDENGNIKFFTNRKYIGINIVEGDRFTIKSNIPMSAALNGIEITILDSNDYRGEPVVAVTRYIDDLKVGLVLKIDRADAFANVSFLERNVVIINIIVMLFVSLAIFVLTRYVSKDIEELTFSVDKILGGHLKIKLGKSNIYEVQNLIDSLNRILASLKLAVYKVGISRSELGLGAAIKAKKTAQKKYKVLYESSQDAIMTLAPPSWNFSSGNPATIKMFRIGTEEKFVSLGPGQLSPKRQPDGKLSSAMVKKMIMRAMKDGSAFFNWTHRRFTGEDFPATVLLTRVEIGDKKFLQATVRDITELKMVESKVEAKRRELERFAKLSIGREKKMIELKKKIKRLQKNKDNRNREDIK